jgi:hypothetical protein
MRSARRRHQRKAKGRVGCAPLLLACLTFGEGFTTKCSAPNPLCGDKPSFMKGRAEPCLGDEDRESTLRLRREWSDTRKVPSFGDKCLTGVVGLRRCRGGPLLPPPEGPLLGQGRAGPLLGQRRRVASGPVPPPWPPSGRLRGKEEQLWLLDLSARSQSVAERNIYFYIG